MVLVIWAAALAAQGAVDPAAHRSEIESWQKARDTRLRAGGGWLSLAGLFWLKPGPNHFGVDKGNDIVLDPEAAPSARGLPGRAGTFLLAADGSGTGSVSVELAPRVSATLAGKPVVRARLRSDASGAAGDILTMGALTMQVIVRQGRVGIRLKDAHSKARRAFKGLRYYPVDPRYRVVARFTAHPEPVSLSVPTVLGGAEALPSPGTVELELEGRTFRLTPVIESPGDKQLFFVFRDLTAGKTTYGSGRFLYAEPPQDGRVVLDFNKAYSPPCAFTPYATCPLPPEQNRLSIPIEAGERDPHR